MNLLESLRYRLAKRGQAVIVVAEGAGQNLLQTDGGTDASGNIRYGDIGLFLKDQINAFFKSRRMEVNLKYIDPSYIVRSVHADRSYSPYSDMARSLAGVTSKGHKLRLYAASAQ